MHPSVTSDHASDCPICGMKLVEIDEPAGHAGHGPATPAGPAGLATVTIDPRQQQLIGLRTARVRRGPVAGSWRTVGRVEVDATRVRKMNVKVDGFIERVLVDFVGQPVRRGQALFTLYSPGLLVAQDELLLARRTSQALGAGGALAGDGEALVAAARRRLQLADVPQAEIEQLERTGEPRKTLTFVSPIAGVVTAKNIVEGASVRAGDTPYEITDLSLVWVMADLYESDLGRVRPGMPATVSLAAFPNRKWQGRVGFIDPVLDPRTRTARARIEVRNPTGELRPAMFGDVVLSGKPRQGLLVPADAVLRSGTRDVLFVARGQGKLEPREVELGTRGDGDLEIVAGVAEGEEVATRAAFLVDSESQLRAALRAIGGS
jgi:Cu(I)/Ag(I) efflux system membrane fusion protein